jgi:thiol-disulfide isomerase/thioredoxin
MSSGKPYALPQLRVYDAGGRLVYNLTPGEWKPATIGSVIDQALKSGRAVPGPTLQQTLADLQTTSGHPAGSAIAANGTPLIFDYWATWCIPCKKLEKALLAWAAQKPPGSVQIVKAETDIMKAMRASGQRTFMMKKDAAGNKHMMEVR